MTKEELEKEAEEKYSEVDREFITCQDEGEVFNIGYVLGAEPREKRITELEMTVGTLRNFSNEQATCIERLEKENEQWKQRNETLKDALEHARKVYGDDLEKAYKEIAELKRDKEDLIFIRNQNAKCMCEDKESLAKAKKLIENIVRVTWGEGWNYSLDWKVKAEQFLKDSEVEI